MPDEIRPGDGGLGSPAKRGRGRPRKDGSPVNGSEKPAGGDEEFTGGVERLNGHAVTDPLDLPAESGSGDADAGSDRPRKRRARKDGAREKEEATQNLAALLKIERLLVTGCFFLGNIANAPELHITEAEAAEIGDALKELSRHYPLGMSEKKIAWINFSFAVGGVFSPKIVAIYRRPKRPGPERVVTPIREAAAAGTPVREPGPMNPVTGAGVGPEAAKVPSQMWNQPGDIVEDE